MPGVETLTAADRAQLAESGIPIAEAERQLAFLATKCRAASLLRPAIVGDGIERIRDEEVPELLARADRAREQGRFLKFVPASGAASRMFRSLAVIGERFPDGNRKEIRAAAERGETEAREVLELCHALPAMALGRELTERRRIDVSRLADIASAESLKPLFELFFSAVEGDQGGDWRGFRPAELPKGLLPFHWAGHRPRSAFEEQLAEGQHYLRDAQGVSRFHFTVASDSRGRFAKALEDARRNLEVDGSRLEVAFSEQQPSTQALALDETGRPARTADGRLLLRPAGHGALLHNLAQTGGDLVFVKNIDNLLPEGRHAGIAHWKRLLAGKLLEVEASRRAQGPWRVCGVVANAGEPGGGPFWVESPEGAVTLQIVESAEVDSGDPDQIQLFRGSTHFNPVDIVVALRDPQGEPRDLDRYVDPARGLVAEKSESGRRLRVYERPGLWNGAMARWNTIFVEVPAWTFAPVKTVLDLTRAEHLPPTR